MHSLDYPYQEKWQKYRNRENLRRIVVSISIVILAVLVFFTSIRFSFFMFLLLTLSFIIFEMFIKYFDCPKCGKKFFSSGYLFSFVPINPIDVFPTEKCLHCGLGLYEGSSFSEFKGLYK